MELKMYRCAHCGNIVLKLVDGKVPMMCCGQPMEELKANVTDGAVEKHVPQVTREGDKVTVQVGSVVHPMLEEHLIQFIAAVSGDKVTVKTLKAGEAPVLELVSKEPVTAYEYCNLHGYWMGKE